jgi:hypothetical protein
LLTASYSNPTSLIPLTLNDYQGVSINYNVGAFLTNFGYGNSTIGNGNYGQKMFPTYNTTTIGINLISPVPLTFTRSVSSTKFLKTWK